MHDLADFLDRYGQLVLFAAVFVQQIGVPIPAIPVLLGAGALAGTGRLSAPLAIALAVAASLPGDLLWYYLGLRRGRKVLATLCRISLEPDSCVRKTERFFVKNGPSSLLVARFLPGLSTVATPLAGVFRVALPRFLAFDVAGALIYAVVFIGLGYALGDKLEQIAGGVRQFGALVAGLMVVGVVGYLVYRFVERRRVLRSLRVMKVEPADVKRLLDDGEEVFIVDLRSAADVEDEPFVLPGALRVDIAELETDGRQIPRDREIVLYCTCPNEASSARAALLLKRRGITRVRPLVGGYAAWRELGYPVDPWSKP